MTDRFGEQWFSESSQVALAELARSTKDIPGAVVEVGCWTGRSTVALAQAVAPDLLHAVDTWEGSPGEISAELAANRDVFAQFNANIDALTDGNVVPHRCDWRDFFDVFDGPIRFLHIDATHTYEEVKANIEIALPHMVPGSVMCGDDQHHPPIRKAVMDTLGNAFVTASLWHWRFDG